jgi:hypothetical protein
VWEVGVGVNRGTNTVMMQAIISSPDKYTTHRAWAGAARLDVMLDLSVRNICSAETCKLRVYVSFRGCAMCHSFNSTSQSFGQDGPMSRSKAKHYYPNDGTRTSFKIDRGSMYVCKQ